MKITSEKNCRWIIERTRVVVGRVLLVRSWCMPRELCIGLSHSPILLSLARVCTIPRSVRTESLRIVLYVYVYGLFQKLWFFSQRPARATIGGKIVDNTCVLYSSLFFRHTCSTFGMGFLGALKFKWPSAVTETKFRGRGINFSRFSGISGSSTLTKIAHVRLDQDISILSLATFSRVTEEHERKRGLIWNWKLPSSGQWKLKKYLSVT